MWRTTFFLNKKCEEFKLINSKGTPDLWKNGSTKELRIGNKIWIKSKNEKPRN